MTLLSVTVALALGVQEPAKDAQTIEAHQATILILEGRLSVLEQVLEHLAGKKGGMRAALGRVARPGNQAFGRAIGGVILSRLQRQKYKQLRGSRSGGK